MIESTDFRAGRVFLIVADSLGIGAAADAARFGDEGANTLASVVKQGDAVLPQLCRLGLGCIDGVDCLPCTSSPMASVARLCEISNGKDTTVGHFELAELITEAPFPTYPKGFPRELLDRVDAAIGTPTLCGMPYSGTDVIRDFGEEHLRTGRPIVYTSADSVFQIATHESLYSRQQLYDMCTRARSILCGKDGVARVIARPFAGEAGEFYRTDGRHDFSLPPRTPNTLTELCDRGLDVIGVGKIGDIFCSVGLTESIPTHGNTEGLRVTEQLAERDLHGLCFINLVDFDMLYGHRQDAYGYARALEELDAFLPGFMAKMRSDDLLIITADHGCDPCDNSTDHTREDVPLLMYSPTLEPRNLGTLRGLCTVGELVRRVLE